MSYAKCMAFEVLQSGEEHHLSTHACRCCKLRHAKGPQVFMFMSLRTRPTLCQSINK